MVLVLEVAGSASSLSLPWLGVGGHGDVGLRGGGGWLAAWKSIVSYCSIWPFMGVMGVMVRWWDYCWC